MSVFYTISNRTPYRQDPVKVVRHELSSLSAQKESDIVKTLNVHDVFPSADTKQSVPSDITSVFADFFHDFHYSYSEISRNREIQLRLLFPLPHLTVKHWQKNTPVR